MEELKKSIGEGFAGDLYGTLIQMQMEAGALPISGKTYFVSKDGTGTTGLSWATAFTKVADAITASNASMVKSGCVGRNRIYINNGTWTEDLSVFPKNCDVIGVGSYPRISGVQDITTAHNDCHFFNVHFRNASGDTATPLVKLTANAAGIWFIDCVFDCRCVCTAALNFVYHGNQKVKVKRCQFYGNPQPTVGIKIDGGFMLSEIVDNYIRATGTGIQVAHAVTTWDYHSIIKGNVIVGADSTELKLGKGISLLSSVGNSRMVIVHNWISADIAIHYANDALGLAADINIDNHVTEAGSGGIEVSGS